MSLNLTIGLLIAISIEAFYEIIRQMVKPIITINKINGQINYCHVYQNPFLVFFLLLFSIPTFSFSFLNKNTTNSLKSEMN